jgi:hypothetical protein
LRVDKIWKASESEEPRYSNLLPEFLVHYVNWVLVFHRHIRAILLELSKFSVKFILHLYVCINWEKNSVYHISRTHNFWSSVIEACRKWFLLKKEMKKNLVCLYVHTKWGLHATSMMSLYILHVVPQVKLLYENHLSFIWLTCSLSPHSHIMG